MNEEDFGLAERAAELREAFDSSFAAPIETGGRETVDCIGIRLGAARYAMRLADIAGLHAGVSVAPCPSVVPELLGIASIRGTLIAAYDLAALIGCETGPNPWMVLVRGAQLGLAFAGFEGLLQFEPVAIAGGAERTQPHVEALARSDGLDWPLIDMASLLAAIRLRLPSTVARSD